MLCKAMDFKVLDDVRQVDDQQCFVTARRLAREEGIFAGGSSGAAVHVAVELAKEVGKGKNIVVVLPDSRLQLHHQVLFGRVDEGQRLPRSDGSPGHACAICSAASALRCYTVKATDHAKHAVELMKRHGISQLPVIEPGNKPVAMLHEVDLLQALLDGRHKLDEPISAVMKPLAGVVTLRTPVSRLKELSRPTTSPSSRTAIGSRPSSPRST